MNRPLVLLCLLSLLAACGPSSPLPVLTPAQRAKYLDEIIERRPECTSFREQLKAGTQTRESLDAIFQSAIKAKCVEKEV
ncbi:MAG: hypothetical protein EKK46_00445 [Rhodocyclaceae bacterium]|nr:MAG: hypothetical protein EKK46_00445 [Rhodocyclaceae bacterium]